MHLYVTIGIIIIAIVLLVITVAIFLHSPVSSVKKLSKHIHGVYYQVYTSTTKPIDFTQSTIVDELDVFDGVKLVQPSCRVLVKNQLNANENGIYDIYSDSKSHIMKIERSYDLKYDSQVIIGNHIFVQSGIHNGIYILQVIDQPLVPFMGISIPMIFEPLVHTLLGVPADKTKAHILISNPDNSRGVEWMTPETILLGGSYSAQTGDNENLVLASAGHVNVADTLVLPNSMIQRYVEFESFSMESIWIMYVSVYFESLIMVNKYEFIVSKKTSKPRIKLLNSVESDKLEHVSVSVQCTSESKEWWEEQEKREVAVTIINSSEDTLKCILHTKIIK
jgi:hypothetical protein